MKKKLKELQKPLLEIAAKGKQERLSYIYEKLSSNDGISKGSLAKMLGVSTKTIDRDFEQLRDFGIEKRGHKWFVKEMNDNAESITLEILDMMAKNIGETFYLKAHPLLLGLKEQLEQPIFTNLNTETLDDKSMESFSMIEKAIVQRNEISFDFKDKRYRTQPLKLALFEGFWYLLAFDMKASGIFKKFYLKDISNIKILKSHFELPEGLESRLKNANNVWFSIDSKPIFVELFISKEFSKYLKRKPLRGQNMREEKDGSLVISLQVSNFMEILPFIYCHVPHIKVLSPKELRDEVKKTLKDYLKEIGE